MSKNTGWLAAKQAALKAAAEDMLNTKLTKKEICARHGVSWPGVWKYMKEHGPPTPRNRRRKYHAQWDYFRNIDSEEKAYWLGFIFADGSIFNGDSERAYRLQIQLARQDRDHIVRFLKTIHSDKSIQDYVQQGSYAATPMSRVWIDSREMVRDLQQAGVPRRKQFQNHGFPYLAVPAPLHAAFIRGLFDGDGAISHYSDRLHGFVRGEFSITRDQVLLRDVQVILAKACNLAATRLKAYKGKRAVSLRYGGAWQLQRIGQYLYDGASIFLPRKRDGFSPFLSKQAGPYLQA